MMGDERRQDLAARPNSLVDSIFVYFVQTLKQKNILCVTLKEYKEEMTTTMMIMMMMNGDDDDVW